MFEFVVHRSVVNRYLLSFPDEIDRSLFDSNQTYSVIVVKKKGKGIPVTGRGGP
jgi:hypothetical protein